MIKAWIVGISTMVAAGMMTANAGSSCCPGAAAKAEAKVAKAKAASCADDCLAELTLTDEQKQKVTALMQECNVSGCSEESAEKLTAGLKSILSEDQLTRMKDNCAKKGCTLGAVSSTGEQKADS